MGINYFFRLTLFFLFVGNTCFGQGVEEQRKYVLSNGDSLFHFITSSGELNGLATYNHSEYTYYDIYLDTPDFSLAKNHLSLRFRKRNFGEDVTTYGFQLKSEMENSQGLRMEVEETELDFYKVKTEQDWTPLPEILNVFFSQLENNAVNPQSKEIQLAVTHLQEWIRNNSEGPITPFQKIAHLNLPGLDRESLKTLTPVMYGSEKRLRSHLYIDTATSNEFLKNIPQNNIPQSDLPPFFKMNSEDLNWILETSLDSAVFFPLIKSETAKVEIYEFEVENKYFIRATGTAVMDMFEKSLKEKFGAVNGIDSKYLQSLKKFQGQ